MGEPGESKQRLSRPTRWGVGLIGLFVLAHTPPVQEATRRLVESLAPSQAGYTIRLERLDYRLWRGDVSAEGVSIDLDDAELAVERVSLQIRPFSGHVVRLERPRLVWREEPGAAPTDGEAVPSQSEGSQPWMELLALGEIVVVDGAVVIDSSEDFPLALTGVDGVVRTSGGRVVGDVQADVTVGPLSGIRIAARFESDDSGRLRLTEGTVTHTSAASRESRASVEGVLSSTGPLGLELESQATASADLVRAFVEDLERAAPIEGGVQLVSCTRS